jgi:hypothetical protein
MPGFVYYAINFNTALHTYGFLVSSCRIVVSLTFTKKVVCSIALEQMKINMHAHFQIQVGEANTVARCMMMIVNKKVDNLNLLYAWCPRELKMSCIQLCMPWHPKYGQNENIEVKLRKRCKNRFAWRRN